MAQAQVSFSLWMTSVTCAQCGIEFGMPSEFQQRKRERGGEFHCPNGHSNVYRVTELDRVRKQVEVEKRRADLEATQRRHVEAQLGKVRKQVARVNCGVCPHCNRTFRQLAAHMKSKHGSPEAAKEQGSKGLGADGEGSGRHGALRGERG